MRLKRLHIRGYKNIRTTDIDFGEESHLNAFIGNNGCGKSNLIEAVLLILLAVYFKEEPGFSFELSYEVHRRQVNIRSSGHELTVKVDGEDVPLSHVAMCIREGAAQVYFPDSTFVYYSGECDRLRTWIARYRRSFQAIVKREGADSFQPLFVEADQQHAKSVFLGLFAHGENELFKRMGVHSLLDVSITLTSPDSFDPMLNEPKLWGTLGATRRVIAAIHDTATSEEGDRHWPDPGLTKYKETRTYRFAEDKALSNLAERLERVGDNLYLAVEMLRARGMLKSVDYSLVSKGELRPFGFDHLSEGEKQLIAVIGGLRLCHQAQNLVLLDEPDTHLNPKWLWEYTELLKDALGAQKPRRTSTLLTTHDPIMISGLTKNQVFVGMPGAGASGRFQRPHRDPRGQGIANLVSSKEYFGLPSSLDKQTQQLLDERLLLSLKETLTAEDRKRLTQLNQALQILTPGISERDPNYVAFLRQQAGQELS